MWNSVGNGGCEKLFTTREYINAYSSLIFNLVGGYGLFFCKTNDDLTRSIYTSLFMTGIGSFMYHWSLFRLYNLFDIIPMFFMSWYLNYLVWKTVFTSFISKGKMLDTFLDISHLLTHCALVFTLACQAVDGDPWGIHIGFIESFATPQISSAVGGFILYMKFRNIRNPVSNGTPTNIIDVRYMIFGIALVIFGAVVWLTTELDCFRYRKISSEFDRYTHAIWHISMAISVHYLIQMITSIKYYSEGKRFVLKNRWFPLVELLPEEDVNF